MEQYASFDLSDAWRASYRKVMGLSVEKPPTRPKSSSVRITNLLPLDDIDGEVARAEASGDQTTSEENKDHWTNTAIHIRDNIERMGHWICEKRPNYCGVTMPDQEASLIQSTVTSFAATTASEIESLRGLIGQGDSEQITSHQTSIVQILMARLKEEVMDPFAKMQKLRARASVRIWQNPMECKLVNAENRFLPTRPTHLLHRNFYATYQAHEVAMERPKTGILFRTKRELQLENESVKKPRSEDVTPPTPSPKAVRFSEETTTKVVKLPYQQQADDSFLGVSFDNTEQLHQEAVLLTASLQGDLDSVQKMEQMMVDITGLLSQFSELVSEQQESVYEIRDASSTAKQNMESGEEELLKAKETTKQSSHYMAKSIAGMAFVLLFFNWIRP